MPARSGGGDLAAPLLVRRARLVRLGDGSPPPSTPVDVRISGGLVAEVAPVLRRDPGEPELDAAGRWAIPGLWDAHVHLAQWSQARLRLDLSGAAGPDEVAARVAAHVAGLPAGAAGTAVLGYGYRWATWPRLPTVAELDAVSGSHPVALVSGDAHNGWLNSRALALLGLRPRSDALAEREWFAVLPRLGELPADHAAADVAYADAVRAAAARGVVGVVDMECEDGRRAWPQRLARGVDLLRVRAATYPDGLDAVLAAGLRTGDPLPGGRRLLTMGPLKIIADGSLNTGTAYCHRPYPGLGGSGPTRGRLEYPAEEIRTLLARARRNGLAAAVHAIGDAAVALAVDAFAATWASGSVEHAQLVERVDLVRMARLGVVASVQPAHLLDDRDVAERIWPDRDDRCFALRSMVAAGVRLALGSDAPVAPLDPWLAMAAAVHRSADARPPWNPAQSLTPGEALAASTDGQRTPGVGARGDLALLDSDPLAAAADPRQAAAALRGVRVAATVLAGRVTHRAI